MKEKNTYVIMREYHKWEEHEANFHAIMNLIDILISDEPQQGMEDLHTVDIPHDIEKKLQNQEKQQEMETSQDQSWFTVYKETFDPWNFRPRADQ